MWLYKNWLPQAYDQKAALNNMKSVLNFIFLFLGVFSLPAQAGILPKQHEYVVLLHGIGRSKNAMQEMADDMSQKGYTVFNIDYPSRKKSIEDLADDIKKTLDAQKLDENHKIHFIGHSMGGLIIRAYIHAHRPENLGRVVMLGTPNHGSEVADLLAGTTLFNGIYGLAGQQLVTDQEKFKAIFGAVDYEAGVIAGDRSIDPVSSWLIIPGKDDGKVSISSTKLDGMKDHIVIHATHTFMPSNAEVIAQAEYFLENGTFRR
jgi:triacylglycerol lipase